MWVKVTERPVTIFLTLITTSLKAAGSLKTTILLQMPTTDSIWNLWYASMWHFIVFLGTIANLWHTRLEFLFCLKLGQTKFVLNVPNNFMMISFIYFGWLTWTSPCCPSMFFVAFCNLLSPSCGAVLKSHHMFHRWLVLVHFSCFNPHYINNGRN